MGEMIPDQQGRLLTYTQAAPGAGIHVKIDQPPRVRWRLLSFFVRFVTSGNAGNRVIDLQVTRGAVVIARYVARTNIAAGQTIFITYYPGAINPIVTGGNTIQGNLSPLAFFNDGVVVETTSVALDVGDQFSAPKLLVEEWIEPMA